MATDYYLVLGVARTATTPEIREAYRKLVIECHPDANLNDPKAAEKTRSINKAYETLRDPEKRKEYDLSLTPGKSVPATGNRSQAQRDGAAPPMPRPGAGGMFGDVLKGMQGEAVQNAVRGGSVSVDSTARVPTVEIHLSPREALKGATKTIKVNGRLLQIRIVVDG